MSHKRTSEKHCAHEFIHAQTSPNVASIWPCANNWANQLEMAKAWEGLLHFYALSSFPTMSAAKKPPKAANFSPTLLSSNLPHSFPLISTLPFPVPWRQPTIHWPLDFMATSGIALCFLAAFPVQSLFVTGPLGKVSGRGKEPTKNRGQSNYQVGENEAEAIQEIASSLFAYLFQAKQWPKIGAIKWERSTIRWPLPIGARDLAMCWDGNKHKRAERQKQCCLVWPTTNGT